MKLSDFKSKLNSIDALNFVLPNGTKVSDHFHVTEVGEITKHFIDCGGKERMEKVVNFQLWEANDIDHRLKPQKLAGIISLSERVLGIGDLEIEVEYQTDTISKFGLEFENGNFVLQSLKTDCLAKDNCGIPQEQLKVNLVDLSQGNSCTPGGGCC
jgi:hypothetical protein